MRASSQGTRIRFAIGEARTEEELDLLPELINRHGDLSNACYNVDADDLGVPNLDQIELAAKTVQKIAKSTHQGEGNFNFTVNFNCPAHIPYFPAGYHNNTRDCYVIGLETPDLLNASLELLDNINSNDAFDIMKESLQYHVDAILSVVKSTETSLPFLGIDSSAAPSKDCRSMIELYQQLGTPYFGAPGTISTSALLTRVFKSIEGVKLVGFSGLMLAVTEDTGLAQTTQNPGLSMTDLLVNSAVCGIGLDTVPIPGDSDKAAIAALMKDTGTLAFRLNKPLTVRLFPIPGLNAGDMTRFESDDLCNCEVLKL